jgi:ABC-type transport system involved in multi-copper enzyme maturation permease subunit
MSTADISSALRADPLTAASASRPRWSRLLPALVLRSAGQSRYMLAGCAVLMGAFQIVLAGQASAIESTQSFGRIADLVPAFLQRGLGSRALLLASFKGTIALGYFHPVVMVLMSVLAAYVTTEPAHEIESGLVDLILARSVPRHSLLTRSLLLAVIAVGGVALVMAFGTWLGLSIFASPAFESPSARVEATLLLHLSAVAICCGSIGLMVGSRSRRWTTAFTTTILIIVLLYLVDFLALGWPVMRWLAWLTPFHYYPAFSILFGDAAVWRNILVLLSASAVFCVVGYWQFSRRDL